jgi:hypothetical protein
MELAQPGVHRARHEAITLDRHNSHPEEELRNFAEVAVDAAAALPLRSVREEARGPASLGQ